MFLKVELIKKFVCASPAFRPATARVIEGRTPKENALSIFQNAFPPAKSEMQGAFFFRGCRRTRRRAGLLSRWCGIGAYGAIQSHHALRACAVSPPPDARQNRFECCTVKTAILENRFPEPQRSRREAAALLHSPHKILILKGFATLRVAPRLPMQI